MERGWFSLGAVLCGWVCGREDDGPATIAPRYHDVVWGLEIHSKRIKVGLYDDEHICLGGHGLMQI